MFHHKRTRPSSSAFRTGTFLKVQLFGALLMTLALSPANATQPAAPAKLAFHGKLDNGLEVVVVPDRRAPVVTHMVWYRVGGADEPQGKSGIAHFLEHLMFKGTDKIPPGEFSKIVAPGGQDNAFTARDITSYFQRVAKEKLPQVMEMEADRMANLKLDKKEVTTERKVILEERRMRVDDDSGFVAAGADAGGTVRRPSLSHAPSSAGKTRCASSAGRTRSPFYKRSSTLRITPHLSSQATSSRKR